MVVEYEQIENLTPYPDNPRRWIDVDVSRLAESIRRNPELFEARPVIVSKRKDGTQYVLGGHLRLEAAKRLGKYAVPVYRFVGLTEAKEREILLRDNIQNGEWDWDLLTNKWADCAFDDWGLDGGFESEDGETVDANDLSEDFSLKDGDRDGFQQITFQLADSQAEAIKEALKEARNEPDFDLIETYGNENSNGNAISYIVSKWEEQKTS